MFLTAEFARGDSAEGSFSIDRPGACLPPPTLDITLTASCQSSTPVISYAVTTNTGATTVDLVVTDSNGDVVVALIGQPLSGQIVWPGAAVDPQDWPGWALVDGVWVVDESDAILRQPLTIEASVNPTASAVVSYPEASATCAAPSAVDEPQHPASAPVAAAQIPATGSGVTSMLTVLSAIMIGLGAMLFGVTRRRFG